MGLVLGIIFVVSFAVERMFPELSSLRWVWPTRADRSLRPRWLWTIPHAVKANSEADTLIVFLHGTYAIPPVYSGFLCKGAGVTRHATVALSYRFATLSSENTSEKIKKMHRGDESAQAAEIEAFHEAVCFGGKSPFVDGNIAPKDAIVGRLHSLLSYLSKKYASEGWGKFLDASGSIEWDKIIVCGHSQGGSHATYLAFKLPLKKAVLISSPQRIPALGKSFLSKPFETQNIVAFAHNAEDQIDSIKAAHETMNLGERGEILVFGNVELENEDFKTKLKKASIIYSKIKPARKGRRAEHASTAVNFFTPKKKAENIYANSVWPAILA